MHLCAYYGSSIFQSFPSIVTTLEGIAGEAVEARTTAIRLLSIILPHIHSSLVDIVSPWFSYVLNVVVYNDGPTELGSEQAEAVALICLFSNSDTYLDMAWSCICDTLLALLDNNGTETLNILHVVDSLLSAFDSHHNGRNIPYYVLLSFPLIAVSSNSNIHIRTVANKVIDLHIYTLFLLCIHVEFGIVCIVFE